MSSGSPLQPGDPKFLLPLLTLGSTTTHALISCDGMNQASNPYSRDNCAHVIYLSRPQVSRLFHISPDNSPENSSLNSSNIFLIADVIMLRVSARLRVDLDSFRINRSKHSAWTLIFLAVLRKSAVAFA